MTTTLTAREEAIKLLGQGKIRALVLAQTKLTDTELDALIGEVGDDEAMRRAAAAIRRGDRTWAEAPAAEVEPVTVVHLGYDDEPAAEATTAPMTPDEAADIIERFGQMDDGGDLPPRVAEAYRVHREHYARDTTEADPQAAELAEAQAGLSAAERSRAARMLATHEEDPMPAPAVAATPSEVGSNLGDSKPGPQDLEPAAAVLTMPLARLVDADGTQTVIAEAVIDIRLVPAAVLDWLSDDPQTDIPPVMVTNVRRVLTPEGADIVRGLAQLLEETPEAGRG